MVSSGDMGRRKREGNHSPPRNTVVQDLEQNEESGYPDLQQNKDKLHQGTQRSPQEHLKEEIVQVINENFIEMLLDMVNQNVQEALKKF
jgi:hypothetical protein